MENPNVNPSGAENVGRKLRLLLAEAMKASGKSRAEIAREMKEAHGCPVTEHTLNDFCRGATKERDIRFPAAWLPAFEEATGDNEIMRYLMGEALRGHVELGERVSRMQWVLEHLRAEIAKLTPQQRRTKQRDK